MKKEENRDQNQKDEKKTPLQTPEGTPTDIPILNDRVGAATNVNMMRDAVQDDEAPQKSDDNPKD